jgi:hypothetical protein
MPHTLRAPSASVSKLCVLCVTCLGWFGCEIFGLAVTLGTVGLIFSSDMKLIDFTP